jgi:hypothetical protein
VTGPARDGARPPAAALAPVRAALLAAARRDADATVAAADADAAATLADARRRADAVLAEAREQGVAEAAAELAAARAGALRDARAAVLAARRDAYEQLRAAARQAVAEFAAAPGVRDRLVARVHAALGPAAEITDAPGGGVVGRSGRRRIDLSAAGFADRAVEVVAADREEP